MVYQCFMREKKFPAHVAQENAPSPFLLDSSKPWPRDPGGWHFNIPLLYHIWHAWNAICHSCIPIWIGIWIHILITIRIPIHITSYFWMYAVVHPHYQPSDIDPIVYNHIMHLQISIIWGYFAAARQSTRWGGINIGFPPEAAQCLDVETVGFCPWPGALGNVKYHRCRQGMGPPCLPCLFHLWKNFQHKFEFGIGPVVSVLCILPIWSHIK